MTSLKFIDIGANPSEILELTSLTLYEFETLVPYFDKEFKAHMSRWRIDGKPRTGRSYSVRQNSRLATAEDRLLFVLVYLKNNPLQVLHGKLFGMGQSKVNMWLHLLLPILQKGLRAMGHAPCRTVTALADRLKLMINEAEGATTSSNVSDMKTAQESSADSPLFAMMEPNDASSVRKSRTNRNSSIAVRKKVIL